MAAAVLWLTLLVGPPLLVALMLTGDEPTRRLARVLAPFAAVPALGLALAWPGHVVARLEPWLFEGAFGLDGVGRIFLLLTASLWSIAAFYAQAYLARDMRRDRFHIFFLLAMAGNLGLVGSLDLASFYLFFALMSFASFGLVIHDDTPTAHSAAKLYIAMAILGEALLLAGLMLLALRLEPWDAPAITAAVLDEGGRAVVWLLLAGFGVKAGVVLLHMWLPLAHPAAPTPASAVLSGAMIKAGLLGWLRFMPASETLAIEAGAFIALGLAGALYGVVVGLFQHNPKANLAYSSISQMGFMMMAVGLGLADPSLWPTAALVAALYALHHGLAKSALFLGVGVAQYGPAGGAPRTGLFVGLTLAALSLAGAPLTSGYMAKTMLKYAGSDLPAAWGDYILWLLPVAAVGTAVLMGRFLWLIASGMNETAGERRPGLAGPWLLNLALVLSLTWLVPLAWDLDLPEPAWLDFGAIWAGLWPAALGAMLVMWLIWKQWGPIDRREVPPGDVVVYVHRLADRLLAAWQRVVIPSFTAASDAFFRWRNRRLLRLGRAMFAGELLILRWGAGGVLFLLLSLGMIAAMWAWS